MNIRLTAATKMWLVTSLAFFYFFIQYHVSSTFSGQFNGDVGENEIENRKRLWLWKIVGDESLAEEVQTSLGDRKTKQLARKINTRLRQCANYRPFETNSDASTIYIVTPTYRRPEQQAELTRMAQTLMHVENIYWLVIEDAPKKSPLVAQMLKKFGVRFIHLHTDPMKKKRYKGAKPKGVNSRNEGLSWIRENVNEGVLYFADDDNTYDIELFYEMRSTKKVAMWPVGLVTQTGVSSPIVKNSEFVGFYDGWIGGRKFPVDMAGFAVNIKFLKQRPKAQMAYRVGYEEDTFLKSLAPFEPHEIELKADHCTKLLVWHTQTKRYPPSQPLDKVKFANTNIIQLKSLVV